MGSHFNTFCFAHVYLDMASVFRLVFSCCLDIHTGRMTQTQQQQGPYCVFFLFLLVVYSRCLLFPRFSNGADKLCLADQLFNAVLLEFAVVTSGQLVVTAGDFHSCLEKTTGLAKCFAHGLWIDLLMRLGWEAAIPYL